MTYKGGYVHYDIPIGVLCLESYFPKPPGHIRNPLSFSFPIVCHVLKGIDVEKMLFAPESGLASRLIAGAQQLEKDGVKAIIGSCGFMALFQEQLSAHVTIPVFSSSLLQIPLVRLAHGPKARIGVLTASAEALGVQHFAAVGVDRNDYAVAGMEQEPVFSDLILRQTQKDMDLRAMEQAVCSVVEKMHAQYSLDALILECTDLSAFSKAVQEKITVPVYDVNSLAEYAAHAVVRRNYAKSFNG